MKSNRGGSWFNFAEHCRTAIRFVFRPGHRFVGYGFRLVARANDNRRVIRGSAWAHAAVFCRTTYHGIFFTGIRVDRCGLRLVREEKKNEW